MSRSTSELARLAAALASAPALAGAGGGDELGDGGARRLLDGGRHVDLAHPLLDAWMDLDNGVPLQPRIVTATLLRSAELWCELPASGHVETAWLDAFDRMFGALTDANEVLAAVSAAVRDAFFAVLTEHVARLAAQPGTITTPELRWVELANSIVGVRPDAFARAFAPLIDPAIGWTAALRYVSVLAYTGADHPWFTGGMVLWQRWGSGHGLRWSSAATDALARVLDDDHLHAMLATIRRLTVGDREQLEIVRVCDEIEQLQLDHTVPRRRALVLARLRERDPSWYWDDELGAS